MALPIELQVIVDRIIARTNTAVPWPSTKKVDIAFQDNLKDVKLLAAEVEKLLTETPPPPPTPVDAVYAWPETWEPPTTWGPCVAEGLQATGTQTGKERQTQTLVTAAQHGGADPGPQTRTRDVTRPCTIVVPPPPPSGDHGYFDLLSARPDCAVAYSLRDAGQVELYRRSRAMPPSITYDPVADPDPRKQDAMKVVIPAQNTSLPTQLWVPTGKNADPNTGHGEQNLLVTWDFWWGKEFDHPNTKMDRFKGVLQFASGRDNYWLSLHTSFAHAKAHPHNQPPGGPFLTLTYPHTSRGFNFKPPFTRGGANASLPYGWPVPQETRGYDEMLGPLDTETYPQGQEWGVVAERWSRFWAYFERAPELDWTSPDPVYVGTMRAFKWTVWAADTERGATRILHEAIVAPNPLITGGFTYLWLEMNVSAQPAALERIAAGRGPLTAYTRNYVVLHGTSKADVMPLLQQPAK